MNLLTRIETIARLWELIVPDIPKPSPSWIGRWCVYPDQAIERAIIRASKKFGNDRASSTPDPEAVYAYVCGTTRNIFEAENEQKPMIRFTSSVMNRLSREE